jgi:hypothetical protein
MPVYRTFTDRDAQNDQQRAIDYQNRLNAMAPRAAIAAMLHRPIVRPRPVDVPFVCDYSLSQRTADYSKWGLRA